LQSLLPCREYRNRHYFLGEEGVADITSMERTEWQTYYFLRENGEADITSMERTEWQTLLP